VEQSSMSIYLLPKVTGWRCGRRPSSVAPHVCASPWSFACQSIEPAADFLLIWPAGVPRREASPLIVPKANGRRCKTEQDCR
jgi:hypothetical protein